MKLFKVAAWASGIIAVIIMILAVISLIAKISFFGFGHIVNYFSTANSFLLLAILCLLAYHNCQCCKEK
jgi:hypothetical protein